MSRDKEPGADTFETVRDRYEHWEQTRAEKPYQGPPRAVQSTSGGLNIRLIAAAIGIGLGALLLVLAAYSFWVAYAWSGIARGGATVGYTLVGFFLTVAGVGGIIATWNHNFRVLDPNRAPAPAHH